MTDVTGQAGKYLLVETLGAGAFSKVKRGVHEDTKEEVAVKIVKKHLLQEKNQVGLMRRELTIMQSLNHKYIVKLISVMSSSEKVYIVMELAPNGDLYEVVNSSKGQGLEDSLAREYFRQLLEAVSYIHKRGVCHRDLKPENILIARDGSIRVSDFGLSAIISQDKDGVQNDIMRTVCGTPAYVAPEVITNPKAGMGYHGKSADVWACGVILYTLVVGYLPFDGDTLDKMLLNVISGTLKIPSHVSPGARSLLEALLERDVQKRLTAKQALEHSWMKNNEGNDRVVSKKMERIASFFFVPQNMGDPSDEVGEKIYRASSGRIDLTSNGRGSENSEEEMSTASTDKGPISGKMVSTNRPGPENLHENLDVIDTFGADEQVQSPRSSHHEFEKPAFENRNTNEQSKIRDVPLDSTTDNTLTEPTSISDTEKSQKKEANLTKKTTHKQESSTVTQVGPFEDDMGSSGGVCSSLEGRLKLERMMRVRTTAPTRMLSKRFQNPNMPDAPVAAPTFEDSSNILQSSKIRTKLSASKALEEIGKDASISQAQAIQKHNDKLGMATLPAQFSPEVFDSESDNESERKSSLQLSTSAKCLKASVILTDDIREQNNLTPLKALITVWSKQFLNSNERGAQAACATLKATRQSLEFFRVDAVENAIMVKTCSWSHKDVKKLKSLVFLWSNVLKDEDITASVEPWMEKENVLVFLIHKFSDWQKAQLGSNATTNLELGKNLDFFESLKLLSPADSDRDSASSNAVKSQITGQVMSPKAPSRDNDRQDRSGPAKNVGQLFSGENFQSASGMDDFSTKRTKSEKLTMRLKDFFIKGTGSRNKLNETNTGKISRNGSIRGSGTASRTESPVRKK